MEFGLLLLRVVIGALFVGHGAQKFGWFDGPGVDGVSGMFDSLGYRQPRRMAIAAGAAEAGAGALLVLGLFTPFAAAAVIGIMLNAIVAVHLSNGLWAAEGGYEYNLVLITGAAALAFSGPGPLAVDGALPVGLAGPVWGLLALVLGLAAGAGVLSLRTNLEAAQEEPAEERGYERV